MTIFAKILDGDIPCHKVYEDDHVLAFLDVAVQLGNEPEHNGGLLAACVAQPDKHRVEGPVHLAPPASPGVALLHVVNNDVLDALADLKPSNLAHHAGEVDVLVVDP